MSEKQDKRFNYIFSKLVEKPNDMVGLLAYGEYKREKIEYIQNFKARNDGKCPDDGDLAIFHDISNARISQYRAIAENSLADIQSELLDDQVKLIYADFESKYKQDLLKYKTSWSAAILQSFTGSVVYTFFLGVIIVIILGARHGINAIAQEGVKMLTGQ